MPWSSLSAQRRKVSTFVIVLSLSLNHECLTSFADYSGMFNGNIVTPAKAVVCPLDAEDVSKYVQLFKLISQLMTRPIEGLSGSAPSTRCLPQLRQAGMEPQAGLWEGTSLSISARSLRSTSSLPK